MAIDAISSTSALTQVQANSASTTASKTEKAAAPPKPAGAAPAGGAAPAASTSSTSSTSSTAKIYEPADANKDGVVSFQEELLYSLTHPTDETEKQTEVSSSQLQNGLKSYKQGQQADGSTESTTLAAI